ncbi:hypothetical protein C8J57DRAFT_1252851 [Mycena rebaudengoi]|nr:hypothetical protein C8J57DRAFT_1252851 [Mycena rebaudengoi]
MYCLNQKNYFLIIGRARLSFALIPPTSCILKLRGNVVGACPADSATPPTPSTKVPGYRPWPWRMQVHGLAIPRDVRSAGELDGRNIIGGATLLWRHELSKTWAFTNIAAGGTGTPFDDLLVPMVCLGIWRTTHCVSRGEAGSAIDDLVPKQEYNLTWRMFHLTMIGAERNFGGPEAAPSLPSHIDRVNIQHRQRQYPGKEAQLLHSCVRRTLRVFDRLIKRRRRRASASRRAADSKYPNSFVVHMIRTFNIKDCDAELVEIPSESSVFFTLFANKWSRQSFLDDVQKIFIETVSGKPDARFSSDAGFPRGSFDPVQPF